MRYQVKVEGQEFKIGIREKQGALKIDLDGKEIEADLCELKNNKNFSLLVDGKIYDLEIERKQNNFEINREGKKYSGEILEETFAKLRPPLKTEVLKQKELKAPMPGLIVKIEVKEGDKIKPGQGVLIMEAMKMENEIKSPWEGKVQKILVQEKASVDKDQSLVLLE